ncbi:MAG: hypothetical protein IIW54_03265 [Lachnospiraceae bacterium]|nr:hypothetical protein [Lachnospiraceae bacterium]
MTVEHNITDEWRLYMYLLRCAIRGEELDEKVLEEYKNVDSISLRERANQNKQGFLMCSVIDRYCEFL